jgi:hypothetical protein
LRFLRFSSFIDDDRPILQAGAWADIVDGRKKLRHKID